MAGSEERRPGPTPKPNRPAASSLGQHRHNLPAQSTRLIGREHLTSIVRAQVLREDVRLLTFTGPPGIGKTRLALEVAADVVDRFEHGAIFIDLTPISDPALVGSSLAQAMGIKDEASDGHILSRLKTSLGEKRLLVLLDNFEQVLNAASQVADLLANCPGLKILVTSRERLHLSWEHEFPVPPLELPDPKRLPDPESLAAVPAVALFVERARAARPDFVLNRQNARAVAEICARLDGLPLAIELAAARVKVLPPVAMLVRMERGLTFLSGGGIDRTRRHQALRAAIEWSYALLAPQEQALFRRLAVFVGGFTLEAAEAVADPNRDPAIDVLQGVASLTDKSLLRQEDADDEARFRMLATIREYGLGALAEAGEADETARLHTDYFLALAEQAEPWARTAEQEIWLRRLERDLDNLRAAMQSLAGRGEHQGVLRLAGALGWFWDSQGMYSEGRRWLDEALRKNANSTTATKAKCSGPKVR